MGSRFRPWKRSTSTDNGRIGRTPSPNLTVSPATSNHTFTTLPMINNSPLIGANTWTPERAEAEITKSIPIPQVVLNRLSRATTTSYGSELPEVPRKNDTHRRSRTVDSVIGRTPFPRDTNLFSPTISSIPKDGSPPVISEPLHMHRHSPVELSAVQKLDPFWFPPKLEEVVESSANSHHSKASFDSSKISEKSLSPEASPRISLESEPRLRSRSTSTTGSTNSAVANRQPPPVERGRKVRPPMGARNNTLSTIQSISSATYETMSIRSREVPMIMGSAIPANGPNNLVDGCNGIEGPSGSRETLGSIELGRTSPPRDPYQSPQTSPKHAPESPADAAAYRNHNRSPRLGSKSPRPFGDSGRARPHYTIGLQRDSSVKSLRRQSERQPEPRNEVMPSAHSYLYTFTNFD
jgi:hypothetical protein